MSAAADTSAQRANAPALRPARRLDGLAPYKPPPSDPVIDLSLDLNEGAPCDEAWRSAMETLDVEDLRLYPSPALIEARLASRWGVEPSRVVVTNGGDDAIDRVCRAVLEPGRDALLHTPTFEMIERSVRLAGAETRRVPWVDGPFPLESMLASIDTSVGLLALVTPNNPTGGAISHDDLLRLVDAAEDVGALAMVDLAYIEFADQDPTPALLERPNTVVVRTFSKAFGLAGLRVGYAIAGEVTGEWIRAAGGPFPNALPSLAMASRALDERHRRVDSIQRVRDQRTRFANRLEALGLETLPTQANFVTAVGPRARWLRDGLRSFGIAVKSIVRDELTEATRVTMPGQASSFERLVRATERVLAPQAMLFDLDGVIADVSGSYRRAIIETAATYGVRLSNEDIAEAKREGDANNDWVLTTRLLEARGVAAKLGDVTARFQRCYLGGEGAHGVRETECLIGAPAWYEQMAQRLPLAIVTGRPRDEAKWFLERVGIAESFSELIAMEDADAKPSPAPVELALCRLGVERAWMIGDTPDDVIAARGAGVAPIGVVAPGEGAEASTLALWQAGAARVVDRIEDLEELLP
ncbi:MAG: TIGR01548 family HAD-type hydrolase [Planctomycetota bacterium]